jgi:putative aldouronate transport system substrate-binding protein
MYDEGLIAKDFATQTAAMWTKTRDSGKAGMWDFNASGLVTSQIELNKVDPNGKVDLIPSVVGTDGKGGMMIYGSTLEMAYLNSKMDAKKAEGIIKFFDYMVTDAGNEFFSFGVEGETYKKEGDKIVYEKPKDEQAIYAEDRLRWLQVINDGAYNKLKIGFEPRGNDLLKAFQDVLPKEGRGGYTFDPELSSYSKFPDLAPKFDEPAKLILDHMIKMIYGKEPISDWPKVIEEWKTKGGNEIIKEATERVNKNSGARPGPGSNG